MTFIILLLIVAIAFKLLAGPIGERVGTTAYRRTRFMSDAETRFYKALSATIGGQTHIFVKPRLNDIVCAENVNWSVRQSISNKLRMKHVDFLLCDLLTLTPTCVIELDDSTHARSDRQARDNFVNEALKAAGVPIVHFAVRASYSVEDISQKLSQILPGLVTPSAYKAAALVMQPQADAKPKSRVVLIPTEPPPVAVPKDLKYMPPSVRAGFEKKNSLP